MTIVDLGCFADASDIVPTSSNLSEGDFTDDELTALALAADPDLPIDEDAVPISLYLAQLPIGLPNWYMPAVMVRGSKRWRIPVVLLIVTAFLIIEGLGLCNTFGQLTI
jgi:hypothetical protein